MLGAIFLVREGSESLLRTTLNTETERGSAMSLSSWVQSHDYKLV